MNHIRPRLKENSSRCFSPHVPIANRGLLRAEKGSASLNHDESWRTGENRDRKAGAPQPNPMSCFVDGLLVLPAWPFGGDGEEPIELPDWDRRLEQWLFGWRELDSDLE